MAETSDEIRRELELTRARVGDTIAALEHKVNPRHFLDEHPIAVVGVAFGTGVLLGTTGAATRAVHGVRHELQDQSSRLNQGAGDALDRILGAIRAAAATAITAKVTELMGSMGSSGDGQRRPTRP